MYNVCSVSEGIVETQQSLSTMLSRFGLATLSTIASLNVATTTVIFVIC